MPLAIEVRDAVKSFGFLRALDGASLAIEQGEFFGLLGPNGAGKTTLISILAGLARPTAGVFRVMGHDVVQDYRGARRSLGVVPQELVFDPFFTVRETLRIQSGYFGRATTTPGSTRSSSASTSPTGRTATCARCPAG
jgi:ABC-2 type transport system ATP-binding protein